jgi:transposase InsO family protein
VWRLGFGNPDPDGIRTSHFEWFGLAVRMTMRRFTRLANARSNGHKHQLAMQAIFFAWYNLCRKHESLGGETPAMASNLTDHAWTIKKLIETASAY